MSACLARGCKKAVPDAAIKNLDPFCSSACFRSHHGTPVIPESGMYKLTRPHGDQLTLMQQARLEVDRQARARDVEPEPPGRYAHLMDDDGAF